MNFCSNCGARVALSIPAGDNRERHCCAVCGTIHYQNPRVVVGTIPVWQSRVLLCLRAIEPRARFWTLPAGFLENGEAAADGAIRETDEEAGARIALGPIFSVLDVVHVHQVHLFYRASLLDTDFAPGDESLEVRLFDEEEIPWESLAFQTISLTLRLFFEDRSKGEFGVHTGAISDRRKFFGSAGSDTPAENTAPIEQLIRT